MLATYRPPSSLKSQYLNMIQNIVLVGDLNITEIECEINKFLEDYYLSNLVQCWRSNSNWPYYWNVLTMLTINCDQNNSYEIIINGFQVRKIKK